MKSLSTKTSMSTWRHGCIVLTNWTDGHNHLYLYKYDEGKTDSTSADAGEAIDEGRLRSWRGVSCRCGAEGNLLRVERRLAAGAAGVAGDL